MQWHGIRYDTKIILWSLIILQLLLIGAFWMLQSNPSDDNGYDVSDHFAVHFISSQLKQDNLPTTGIILAQDNDDKIEVRPVNEFSIDFVLFSESGDNYTENITCFRQGIIDDGFEYTRRVKRCRCQPEWHGKDCGQPEVLWRAFMTSKAPLIVSEARTIPHKVFYMITGYFFSIELLQAQIMELENCVDLFIICNKESKMNTKRLKLNFANAFHERILIINSKHNNCTPKLIYKTFKSRVTNKTIKPDDIFIISHNDQILNRKAIKYFKYYDNSPGLIKFRLKYNVYGFFWQHPESTRLGCAATTIGQLEENFKSDPERLILAKKPGIIVGDLNHIGGWYCEYCYQPSEIVDRLQIDSPAIFPRSVKNRQIDSSYIQNLISSGLYVDGELGLNRLHRYADNYYAPEYVEQNGRIFNHVLFNVYLNFDDNDDEYGTYR